MKIHKISVYLTNVLKAEQLIDDGDKDLYIYGFEITFANLINFVIAFGIGIITNCLLEIAVFYLVFISCRSFTGGYHADSYGRCFSLFALTNVIAAVMSKAFQNYINFQGIFLVGAIMAVLWLVYKKAPMEHENRPFTDDERLRFRKRSIQITTAWTVMGILLWRLGAVGMASGFVSAFIAIAFYMAIEGRKDHEKGT